MKNAYVLVDHLGDNGTVTEGMILADVATKRFDALKKRGLVREATAEEVEKGYKPPFKGEAEAKAAGGHQNKKAPDPANKGAN